MAINSSRTLTIEEIRKQRELILALAQRYHAHDVRVFGSEATADSDIDFLVQFDEQASLYDLAGLTHDLQDLFGCRVDIANAATPKKRFLDRVLKDAVTL